MRLRPRYIHLVRNRLSFRRVQSKQSYSTLIVTRSKPKSLGGKYGATSTAVWR